MSDNTTTEMHLLAKIAKAITIEPHYPERELYKVAIDSGRGVQRILTGPMGREEAINWRAHLIAAMVEVGL